MFEQDTFCVICNILLALLFMECDLGIGSAAARKVLFTIVSTTNGYQNKSVEAEGRWLSVWLLAGES